MARTYISTTYAALSIVLTVVLIIFYLANPFINWGVVLNTGREQILQNELSLIALIIFTFFCLGFIFRLIGTILIADQQPALSALFDLISKAISLIFIIILTRISHG